MHAFIVLTLISLTCHVAKALAPRVDLAEKRTTCQSNSTIGRRGELITSDIDYARAMCDGAINCEVAWDPDFGMFLPRDIAGMEPYSDWYAKNVQPFDPWFHGNSTVAQREAREEEGDVSEPNTSLLQVRHHPPKGKHPPIYYTFVRKKRNTVYGHQNPGKFIQAIKNKCHANSCGPGGATHQVQDVQYVAPNGGGSGVTTGTLVGRAKGSFAPSPGSTYQRDHFFNALQHMSHRTSKLRKKVHWGWCFTGDCGGGSCQSGNLDHQYSGGTYFQIARYVRVGHSDRYAIGGHLVISVKMFEEGNHDCSVVLQQLGVVMGAVPDVGSFVGPFFLELSQWFC